MFIRFCAGMDSELAISKSMIDVGVLHGYVRVRGEVELTVIKPSRRHHLDVVLATISLPIAWKQAVCAYCAKTCM